MSQPQDPINLAIAKEIDYNTLVESSVTQAEILSKLLSRLEALERVNKKTILCNCLIAVAVIAFGLTMTIFALNYLKTEFEDWDAGRTEANANRPFHKNMDNQTKIFQEMSDTFKTMKKPAAMSDGEFKSRLEKLGIIAGAPEQANEE
jgi:hypothetical protein